MNTNWIKWNQRSQIPNKSQPGIYFLAYTKEDISGKRFSLIKEIIYIGMTISKSGVIGRLDQFKVTMEGKYNTHGGAQRVRFKYKNFNEFFNDLFVSVYSFPVSKTRDTADDWRIKGECVKHEYVSFAEYLDLFGFLPEFNDQSKSKKK